MTEDPENAAAFPETAPAKPGDAEEPSAGLEALLAAESPEQAEGDLEQIRRHGLDPEEIERQLRYFAAPPAPARLVRACTPGDGIHQLAESEWPRLEEAYGENAARGRFSKFVPASGAASRMFRSLDAARQPAAGESALEDARRLLREIDRFAFRDALAEALERSGADLEALRQEGRPGPVLEALLGPEGLGFGSSAKALIPFHREGDRSLTALEEHLLEAAEHLLDSQRRCQVHFTIPQHQELLFRDHLRAIAGHLERHYGAAFDLSTSIQSPETDTVAGSPGGGAFRDEEGRLVFRPGGHGALLRNLANQDADLVFLRNIDNVQPAHRRPEVLRWNKILGGYLVEVERRIVELLSEVERSRGASLDPAVEAAADLLGRGDVRRRWLGRPAAAQQAALLDLLDRPLRVAGMVPNSGEPGGGPFWVRDGAEAEDAATPQIVESSQIATEDPEQAAILEGATHFNPVHMVCRLRSHRGEAYDLERFIDPAAVFISSKSHAGKPLLALERPGLWNGAMAGWNTLFVEIPPAVFAPVKTVFDLLKPEHQEVRP